MGNQLVLVLFTGLLVSAIGCEESASISHEVLSGPLLSVESSTAEKSVTRKNVVTLTKGAADMIRGIQKQHGGTYVRAGATPLEQGCSEFTYSFGLEDELSPADDLLGESHGISIVVDAKSAILLEGFTIDFIDSDGRRGFHFDNPNAVKKPLGSGF